MDLQYLRRAENVQVVNGMVSEKQINVQAVPPVQLEYSCTLLQSIFNMSLVFLIDFTGTCITQRP